MDIEYKKDTLYVYVNEKDDIDEMEERVENIMRTYKIDNLVIKPTSSVREHLHDFERSYNMKHRPKL